MHVRVCERMCVYMCASVRLCSRVYTPVCVRSPPPLCTQVPLVPCSALSRASAELPPYPYCAMLVGSAHYRAEKTKRSVYFIKVHRRRNSALVLQNMVTGRADVRAELTHVPDLNVTIDGGGV